jgi:hypothetical protein
MAAAEMMSQAAAEASECQFAARKGKTLMGWMRTWLLQVTSSNIRPL